MKAQELRIGNYVLLEGMECEVSALDITDITLTNHPAYENEVFSLTGNGVTGIPLTEDWLLKFGFKYNDFSLLYELSFSDKTMSFIENEYDLVYLNNDTIDCEHVHQLQNLYFALTNEELTIKQP